ncbi:MAG: FemAB family PEP-CTERM system-associated protein [Gammaproteobacteria bacterium]|nr:FemAB family PEP-CTERM system-associated protein [Gammaproteobacteria bacterium]MDH5799229.1 FemAB family PEP-CTERM system-associated protein [Gammaproteobacteria bacterium]
MKQDTPNITIKPVDSSYCQQWNKFLESNINASFYHRCEWMDLNESCLGNRSYFLAAFDSSNTIVGAFPLIHVNSVLFGNILCSMPFVNFGGPCSNDTAIQEKLLEESLVLSRSLGADYLEIRSLQQLASPQIQLHTSLHKISMSLQLSNDPETVWNGFSSKHRTNIRRAYKNNLSVRSGHLELLDDFFTVLSGSWKNHGTPIYRKQYFESILNRFGESTRIFVCYMGNNPVAAAFNGYYKNTVEGMWAGALPEYRKAQPNYALYWDMIKDASEKGFSSYHLGRSSAESNSEQFKKKWNANALQLYWQYALNKNNEIPQLNVNNPKYDLAIKLWRKLPLQVTTLVGPLLANRIP